MLSVSVCGEMYNYLPTRASLTGGNSLEVAGFSDSEARLAIDLDLWRHVELVHTYDYRIDRPFRSLGARAR